MSIDASWSARKPGLVPPAVVVAAIEAARKKWARRELSVDDAEIEELGVFGAEAVVEVGDLGSIFIYQPEASDDVFNIAISSTEGAARESFQQLSEIADEIAASIGLRFDDDVAMEEDEIAAPDAVGVTSVKIEIGLSDGSSRVVELAGDPLSTISAEAVDDLVPTVRDAVGWAIEFSERAAGEPTLSDLAVWLGSEYTIEERDDDEPLFYVIPSDKPRFAVMVENGFVTASLTMNVDLELERALWLNVEKLRTAALGLDAEGDWLLWARTHAVGLDEARVIAWIHDFSEDIADVFVEEGEPDDRETN